MKNGNFKINQKFFQTPENIRAHVFGLGRATSQVAVRN